MQKELTKNIREYFIVPKDISKVDASLTHTKKANII